MFDFIKKMLPFIGRNKLETQIFNMKQQVVSTLGPLTETLIESYSHSDNIVKSETGKRFMTDIARRAKLRDAKSMNYANVVYQVTTELAEKFDYLQSYVKQNFNKDIARDALSYQEAQVLRLLDLAHWYTNTCFDFLTIATHEELVATGIRMDAPLPKPTIEKFKQNYDTFLKLTAIWLLAEREFENIIKSTSHIVITDSNDAATSATTMQRDPLGVGFMPIAGSIIMFFRETAMHSEHREYERNKMIKQSLELRVALMREQQESKAIDPKLVKVITTMEDRIKRLSYEIHEYEQSVLNDE